MLTEKNYLCIPMSPLPQASMLHEWIYRLWNEQNKGRTAGRRADDTAVLQEEGREQRTVSRMCWAIAVYQGTVGALQVRRGQNHLPKMPRPLLPPRDERTDTQSNAMVRSTNDTVSPHHRHQTSNQRTIALQCIDYLNLDLHRFLLNHKA